MSLVGVCAGKSSPGATFLAVHLARAMAAKGPGEVLLLDLDPAGGDVACYLGLDPRRGLEPALALGAEIGAQTLLAEGEARDGVIAVSGFRTPRAADDPCLPEIAAAARAAAPMAVADLGRITHAAPAAAGVCDVLLLVVRPDLISVAGADRALCLLPAEQVHLVLSGVSHLGERGEVARALRTPVFAALPLDRRRAAKALRAQEVIRSGAFARGVSSLADRLVQVLASARPTAALAPADSDICGARPSAATPALACAAQPLEVAS